MHKNIYVNNQQFQLRELSVQNPEKYIKENLIYEKCRFSSIFFLYILFLLKEKYSETKKKLFEKENLL